MTLAAPLDRRPASLLAPLRRADWLTAERARAYGWIWLGLTAVIAVGWVLASKGGLDPTGKPIGTDFVSFWSASQLALGGHPSGAYDVATHHAREIALAGRDTGYAAFFYPPIFLLVCLPLALAPYLVSLALWLAVTGAAYWRTVKAWLGDGFGAMPIFAFPAVFSNLGHGQNGFLSAGLFGAGALWLQRRPILAGICLGALAYKPQIGLMIPVALAISGRWKTFAAAALAVIVLTAASVGACGLETWRGFLADSGLARMALEQRLVGDAKMQSAFAAVRLPWNGGLGLALWAPRPPWRCWPRVDLLAAPPRARELRRGPGDDRRGPARQPFPARLRPRRPGRAAGLDAARRRAGRLPRLGEDHPGCGLRAAGALAHPGGQPQPPARPLRAGRALRPDPGAGDTPGGGCSGVES